MSACEQPQTDQGYDGRMDPECVALCDAINTMPGIRTIESCCGHDREPYRVWFKANNLEALPELLYWFDGCHSGFYGWHVHATTDCAMSPVTFRVEGPVGAYDEATEIAALIQKAWPDPVIESDPIPVELVAHRICRICHIDPCRCIESTP